MRPPADLGSIRAPSVASGPVAVPGGGGAHLRWAGATDVGRVRTRNEDSFLVEPPMFVVADGMGGHDAGDIASALAVERLAGVARRGHAVAVDEVAGEIKVVNTMLWDASGSTDETMGTTAVGLAIVADAGVPTWLVFNVGDSRAYCLAEGEMVQVTRDHSYVQELLDAGEVTPEEAAVHPERNVVTRALGAGITVRADYWLRPLRPGERFLLCSDGLTGEVGDGPIAGALALDTPEDAVGALVSMALTGGGRDNVTVVVVDVLSVPGWDDHTTGGRDDEVTAERPAIDAARTPPAAPATSVGATDGARPTRDGADVDDQTLPAVPPPAPPVEDVDEPRELIAWVPPVEGPAPPPEREAVAAISAVPVDPERDRGEAPVDTIPQEVILSMPVDLATEPSDPGDDPVAPDPITRPPDGTAD